MAGFTSEDITIPETPQLNPRNVQKALRKLEGLVHSGASISKFRDCLQLLFTGYRTSAPVYQKGLYIYRIRKCEKPIRLADISYPPAELVKKLGRINNVGESIFYGAAARGVCFSEMDVQGGDYVALSTWKTTESVMLNHVGFSSESESLKDCKRALEEIYDFVKDTKIFGSLNSLVYDYLSYNFTQSLEGKGIEYYRLTVAISNFLLNDDSFDGLIYPSIAAKGNADNIALKPESVDRKLAFVSVQYFFIKSHIDSIFSCDELDSATQVNTDGSLLWSDRKLIYTIKDAVGFLEFRNYGDNLVAYDSDNNRVDPE